VPSKKVAGAILSQPATTASPSDVSAIASPLAKPLPLVVVIAVIVPAGS
jgi:hypothetical protein